MLTRCNEHMRRWGRPCSRCWIEHRALEPKVGYWASRWAEFKRLFKKSWDDEYNRTVLILSTVVFVVTAFGIRFLGWR